MVSSQTVNLRRAGASDIADMSQLFMFYSGRDISANLQQYIDQYPAALAEIEGRIVGFAYSRTFAPDVLELLNIFVKQDCQNSGLGSKLLRFFESLAFDHYQGVVAVNSLLYASARNKRFASNFYLKNQYDTILTTENSRIYAKQRNAVDEPGTM
nr:GNAT family N-acetyltransferase [Neptunicella marina]